MRLSASWSTVAMLLLLAPFLSGQLLQTNTISSLLTALRRAHAPFSTLLTGLSRMADAIEGPYPQREKPAPEGEMLCKVRGYTCERHAVQTADGYLLTVIRIPPTNKPTDPGEPQATPVLLQHGMLASSDSWMLRNDSSNLAFLLHDAGYDVWVGNFRGNAHSRAHVNMSLSDFDFWNFSWHEIGLYDLPAIIDYILSNTGFSNLQYIGHSMGTTSLLVLLSQLPEYNAKIRLASFMAPVAFVSRLQTEFFREMSHIAPELKTWFIRERVWEVMPRSPLVTRLGRVLAKDNLPSRALFYNLAYEIFGFSPYQAWRNMIPEVLKYHPCGTTIRILEHYYEVARTGAFRPLGRGMGDPSPGPPYDVNAVTAPIALYYSGNDYLIYPGDVNRLESALPFVVRSYLVPYRWFNHIDFMWAKDAVDLLYLPMMETMLDVETSLTRGQTRVHINDIKSKRSSIPSNKIWNRFRNNRWLRRVNFGDHTKTWQRILNSIN